MLEAGAKAWAYLGEERIRKASKAVHHPADLVAVDEHGEVFAFVAWDAATGEIIRLFTHPRGWGYGAGRALLEAACTALRSAGCKQAWLWTEERNDAVGFYEPPASAARASRGSATGTAPVSASPASPATCRYLGHVLI